VTHRGHELRLRNDRRHQLRPDLAEQNNYFVDYTVGIVSHNAPQSNGAASGLIFRAFYGVPQTNVAPDGTLINAVRGSSDNLARQVTERKPRRRGGDTDEDWRPDWRVKLIPSYKAHRTAEPVPHALEPQMPVIMEALAAVGVDAVGLQDYEPRTSSPRSSRR